jgi:hypothetical protein
VRVWIPERGRALHRKLSRMPDQMEAARPSSLGESLRHQTAGTLDITLRRDNAAVVGGGI